MLDIHGTIISNEFIKSVVEAARGDVNAQYSNTLDRLFDKRRPKTVADLMKLVRFPKNKLLKSLIESEEIYERALDVIFRYAGDITFNLTHKGTCAIFLLSML